jgi:DNA-binding MarR family transcriptional regulator
LFIANNPDATIRELSEKTGWNTCSVAKHRTAIHGDRSKDLTPHQVTVLGSAMSIWRRHGDTFVTPELLGGRSSTFHSKTAMRLSAMGLLEQQDKTRSDRVKRVLLYRITDLGRSTLAAALQPKDRP